jgi:hypothetical protein
MPVNDDTRNPYAPPEAAVSDVGPRAPGSAPPGTERMYTAAQIGLAAFIGTFLAAGWFYGRNLAATGHPHWKSRAMLAGFVATALSVLVSFLLPENTPNLLIPVVSLAIARVYADFKFRTIVSTHLASGGKQGSWWLVVGVSLLFALALVVVFAVIFLAIYWNELNVARHSLLEQPCSIYAAQWRSSPVAMAA